MRTLIRHLLQTSRLTLALLTAASAFAEAPDRADPAADRPLPPAAALKTLSTDPGLVVDLIAAEPLVVSPSALAWDAHARLFVAENPGYPTGPGPGRPPVGTIVELRDRNGDGVADERVVFAEGFDFPNGIQPWRDGLLVTDAPNLFWLADTNHDGRADIREVWFTGFATNQTTQLRACYPTVAPDGWIYVSRGWSGGVVTSPKWTNLPPVDLKNGDFRFRPDGSAAEAIGGNAQFGMVLDDAGRRFLVSNRNPLMHAVVHPRFWRRHPALPFTDLVQDVSPSGYEAKVFPRSPDTTTSGFMPELMAAPHAGTFTAACGIHQYWGEGLGETYAGNWFICEPAQSLVQRQIAEPAGPTFTSHRATEDRDFLTSTDGWFRPVYAATGPDGTLHVVDMYRRIIDHPDYLPEDARGKLDFVSGKDMGRIWRVRRREFTPRPAALNDASVPQLIDALGDENVWRRQTANRLLLERGPDTNTLAALLTSLSNSLPRLTGSTVTNLPRRATDPARGPHLGIARRLRLTSLLLNRQDARPAPRALLELRNQATLTAFAAAFDESPVVREVFWRLLQDVAVEPKHALPDVPYELVYWWAEDPSPAARFQFALQCGSQADWTPVVPALVRIARLDATNRWSRAAVLSGLKDREDAFLHALFEVPPSDTPGLPELMADLGRMAGTSDRPGGLLERALAPAADGTAWQAAALRGMSEGLRSRGAASLTDALRKGAAGNPKLPEMLARLEQIGRRLTVVALNSTSAIPQRTAAIQFLAELDYAQVRETLPLGLAPDEPLEVKVAAARALGRFNEAEIGRMFTEPAHWNSFPQPVRDLALAALTSRPALLPALLDALERNDLPVWTVDPQRRRQLQNHSDPALRERARRLFADAGGADRRKVYQELRPVLDEAASGRRGHAVFTRTCANCHQLGGEGVRVGPDLTGVRNQPPEALLLHLIVPDAEIYPGYQACEVETRDGRSLTGLVAAETAEAVVLRRAGGEEETVRRSNIASLTPSRLSLMPQELEKTMTRQELADLIAWLRGRP